MSDSQTSAVPGRESIEVVDPLGPVALVPRWVLDAGLSDRAVVLYARLGVYNGREPPTYGDLADLLGCTVEEAETAVDDLVAVGALGRIPDGYFIWQTRPDSR